MTPQEYLKLVKAIRSPNKLIYLSTPITGGPLLEKAKEYLGDLDRGQLKHWVIEPNISHAKSYASYVCNYYGGPVINPADFDVPGWTENEYMGLWEHLLEEIKPDMVFAPGWTKSKGCLKEHEIALKLGLNILEEASE